MKLLFLNHNVAWSGTFFRVFQLARTLVARGHEVTVVTTSRTARLSMRSEVRDGVQLIEAPDLLIGRGRTGWDPWNTLRRMLKLRNAGFDVVHAFDSRPAVVLPALALAREGVPLYMDWADWWGRGGTIQERSGGLVNVLIEGVETWFEESFRHRAVRTTVISRALAERAIGLGVRAEHILRFSNGCDVEHLKPVERGAGRAKLGVASDTPILLHIGLVYPADMRLLLDTWRAVTRTLPKAKLVLLGRPGSVIDPDLLASGSVLAPGFVPFEELQSWLGAADACVIPMRDTVAHRGRWPGKFNDYLCAGRATILPAVGDAAEWVQSTEAGFTCAPNAESFAQTIIEVLTSRKACDVAGERARALACGRLAWPAIAAEVNAFYEQVSTENVAAVTTA